MVPPWGSGAGITDAKLRLNDRNDIYRGVIPLKTKLFSNYFISLKRRLVSPHIYRLFCIGTLSAFLLLDTFFWK